MGYGIKILAKGPRACFTRPEMKSERVSYDCITPSAARGLIESVYWKPAIRWHIDRIHVLNEIRFDTFRRNELGGKMPYQNTKKAMEKDADVYVSASDDRQQRATLYLRDVAYVIEAHFDVTDKAAPGDNPGKFQDIVKRRIQRGQFYHQPCFGCREFPAQFRWCEEPPPCPEELKGPRDLGWMLYDMDYTNPEDIRPLFFRASLEDGVLRVPGRNSREVRG